MKELLGIISLIIGICSSIYYWELVHFLWVELPRDEFKQLIKRYSFLDRLKIVGSIIVAFGGNYLGLKFLDIGYSFFMWPWAALIFLGAGILHTIYKMSKDKLTLDDIPIKNGRITSILKLVIYVIVASILFGFIILALIAAFERLF